MMKRFDKIFVAGCSNSAGGGLYEARNFYQKELGITFTEPLKVVYSHYVSKYFNIELVNRVAIGSGAERLIRNTYDFISDVGLQNCKRTFFFLQVQEPYTRMEFFSKKLNNYVNVGLQFSENGVLIKAHLIDKWLHKEWIDAENYLIIENEINNFINQFHEPLLYTQKCTYSLKGLLSFLEINNIEYMFTTDFNLTTDVNDLFSDKVFKIDGCDSIQSFAVKNKLRIIDDTFGEIKDVHPGFKCHRLYADELIKTLEKKYY